MMTTEPILRHLFRASGHTHVQLSAVAGGEDHRFFHARLAGQVAQRGLGGVRIERHLLAQTNWRGEVIKPDGDQRHSARWFEAAGIRQRRLGEAGMIAGNDFWDGGVVC